MNTPLILDSDQITAFSTHAVAWLSSNGIVIPENQELVVTVSTRVRLPCVIKVEGINLDELLAQPWGEFLNTHRERLGGRFAGALSNIPDNTPVGAVMRNGPTALLRYRNFGRKCLTALTEILQELGLTLGIQYPLGPKEKEHLRFIPTISEVSSNDDARRARVLAVYPNLATLVESLPSKSEYERLWDSSGNQYQFDRHLAFLKTHGIILR